MFSPLSGALVAWFSIKTCGIFQQVAKWLLLWLKDLKTFILPTEKRCSPNPDLMKKKKPLVGLERFRFPWKSWGAGLKFADWWNTLLDFIYFSQASISLCSDHWKKVPKEFRGPGPGSFCWGIPADKVRKIRFCTIPNSCLHGLHRWTHTDEWILS